jgi:parallel beta-helix repeat protein
VDISIEGNKEDNPHLNGCRGAGIFLYRVNSAKISRCCIRNYNGDGISFQQSNDVRIENCEATDNASLGLHPGSGSQRPMLLSNKSFRNSIGVFVCWRVKHGVFENNELSDNATYGISIGHKDTDNLFKNNLISGNAKHGVYFRNESEPMGAHRNRLEGNRIIDNGSDDEGAGIYINGETHDITIVGNIIEGSRYGVWVGEKADKIVVQGNTFTNTQEAISQVSEKSRVEASDNRIESRD